MSEPRPHHLGSEIKRLRLEKGWSQSQLADALKDRGVEISQAALASYERGDRQAGPHRYDAIFAVFGVRIAVLPIDVDLDGLQAELAELREFQRQVGAAVIAAGLMSAALVAEQVT